MNQIIQGDCLEELKTMPDELVDCIITSPPYYGLRDYGVEGQLGLEKTLDGYLEHMLEITQELKRVLKKTGTMWWNHGDSYGGGGMGGHSDAKATKDLPDYPKLLTNMPSKCLTLQNYRLAQRMIDEQQWILRNTLIWHKPNCMPSPVKDRFTVDYEPVFFLTKNKKYWFEPQYEPTIEPYSEARAKRPETSKMKAIHGNGKPAGNYTYNKLSPLGRNKRCVWKIPTQPFKEAHFAVFPEKLIEPMILAGCPKNGIVLDPFMGSGTTAVVAKKLGRNYLGIELNPTYVKIAKARIKAVPQTLI